MVSCPVKMAHPPRIRDKGPKDYKAMGKLFFFSRSRNCGKDGALGFPGGAVVKNPPANAGDTGSSPGLGRSHMPRIN